MWHLLSLDAPTVATVWMLYIAAAVHVHLSPRMPIAMCASVWLLYAADRLLDSRTLAAGLPAPHHGKPSQLILDRLALRYGLEERHFFHHRHRRPMMAGIVLCALLLTALVPQLDSADLRLDLLLGMLLVAYFVRIHTTTSAHQLPKEIAVGLFFSAAVFIPAVSRTPHMRLALLPVALLFAALCSLNCFFIYRWEHVADDTASSLPAASDFTRTVVGHLDALTLALVVLSFVLWATTHQATMLPIPVAALLLLGLDRLRFHFSPVSLRAAADLVLLTPLPLLFMHFSG